MDPSKRLHAAWSPRAESYALTGGPKYSKKWTRDEHYRLPRQQADDSDSTRCDHPGDRFIARSGSAGDIRLVGRYTRLQAKLGRAWTDANRKVIAPHLFNTCNFAGGSETEGEPGLSSFRITVNETVKIKRSLVDSFDSNVGPYGGDNVGEVALIMANGVGRHRRHG